MDRRTTIFIALGSNLQDRRQNLDNAISEMPPKIIPEACSPIYETDPWGYLDQPPFLNQVIQAITVLSPEDLLDYLKDIEARLGRKPTIEYGPRLIDLDILFYDDLVINKPELTIPHPHMDERPFVLVPLADLAPEKVHPELNITVKEMLARVNKEGVRRFTDGDCR